MDLEYKIIGAGVGVVLGFVFGRPRSGAVEEAKKDAAQQIGKSWKGTGYGLHPKLTASLNQDIENAGLFVVFAAKAKYAFLGGLGGFAAGAGIDYLADQNTVAYAPTTDIHLLKAYALDTMHNIQTSAHALKANAASVLHQYALRA